MNTTVKNLKQVTLWADMVPVKTVIFLVYSTDGWYRDIFYSILKEKLEENFVGQVVTIDLLDAEIYDDQEFKRMLCDAV